ncbi:MAG: STAS domain-containing protein [Actinomycetota bacterium]|nr:STAS domain-containing protein [Actinomycetota bacterium]
MSPRVEVVVELFIDGRVLTLSGPLDGRSTSVVREAIYDNLSMHGGLVIDLTDVEWVDATALRMLAVATQYADREGQSLTLRGCAPHLRRVLRHSRLRALLEIEDVEVSTS